MVKTIIGIDISKSSFHACVKTSENLNDSKIKGLKNFDNTQRGFDLLLEWANKRIRKDAEVQFIMEATGVYYEDLAYFLYTNKFDVGVVLANKMNSYAKSLNIKTKTDKVDASIIASFGIERKVRVWKPMSPLYKELRDLSREFMSLKKEAQRAKNQRHAMKHAHEKTAMVIDLKEEQIEFYEKKMELLREEIKKIAKQDKEFYAKIKKVETLPGVGFETIIGIVCETNGFELFNSIRQLVSYAGLDVVFNQSGAFNGKTRISKRGNARIRQILYMPSLSAIQYNNQIKKLYERVVEKNPNIKSKGVVAGMRKLLIYVFILWTKNEEYDSSYEWNNNNID
jgi:transposase